MESLIGLGHRMLNVLARNSRTIALPILRGLLKNILVLFTLGMITVLGGAANAVAQGTAADAGSWVDMMSGVKVEVAPPVRNRRSPDATIKMTITNVSTQVLSGPIRVVIKDLTAGVSVQFPSGVTARGPYLYVLKTPDLLLAPAAVKILDLTILGGGATTFSFTPVVQQTVQACNNGAANYPACNNSALSVVITEPKSLLTIGYSPLTVRGTINRPSATLVINGNRVTHSDGKFEAQVTLEEGYNTIVASATDGGSVQVTDSILVSLDLTPPYVTVDSHTDGQIVSTSNITVTGLVNDIVRGTIEAEQAQVTVNGIAAEVSNRSYSAKDIMLVEGDNAIKITAADQVGNTESKTITIRYVPPLGRQIVLVSGQDQAATINAILPEPLVVTLLDDNQQPVVGGSVVFRVMQDSGKVAVGTSKEGRAVVVQTDAQGRASTEFRLGLRTGTANNKVRAAAVGYEGEVVFTASATTEVGNKLSVNSGNNQRGVIGQVLPAPLVTVVTDEGANVVRGARVRFETIKGGGTFENEESSIEALTDSDGRATVRFILGDLGGIDAQQIRATLIDAPEGQTVIAGFSATAFVPADPGLTTVSGVVLDNQDQPIPGVTMHIEGTTRKTQTNDQGRFVISSAPVGPIHLVADGSTASVAGEFPNLSYRLVTIAGVDNPLAAPVYMVKLNTKEAVFAGKEDVVITLEKFPGFKLEIAKNSVTFPDGSREGYISVTAVNASAVPMAPPNGMQPQFIVTIQPTGTLFDAPARLSLPNVDGHPPGAQVEMYSYDHDLEEFVAIGVGTVTEDGSVIRSNPGVGVVKAGWHCGSQPGGSGTAASCGDCEKCDGTSCVNDPAKADHPLPEQAPGDCQTATCGGSKDDNDDIPENDCGTCEGGKAIIDKEKALPEEKQKPDDCKLLMCGGENTPLDETSAVKEKEPCKFCSAGKIEWEPEDLRCGDGTPAKECYTCRDGNCGNHCTAKLDPPSIVNGGAAVSTLDGMAKKWVDRLSASPIVNASISGIELKGNVEQGQECCADCTEGPSPKSYSKYTANVDVAASITVAVPSAGVALQIPKSHFGDLVVSGILEAGLGGRATANAGGSVEYKDSECRDNETCVMAEVKGSVKVSAGLLATASGKVESCDVNFEGWKLGQRDYSFNDCSELAAIGVVLGETMVSVPVEAYSRTFFGEACSQDSCSGYSYGAVTATTTAAFSISIGGIFQTSVSKEIALQFSGGGGGGNCD